MEIRVELELWCVGVIVGIIIGVIYFSLNIEEIKRERICNKFYKQIDKLKETINEIIKKEREK